MITCCGHWVCALNLASPQRQVLGTVDRLSGHQSVTGSQIQSLNLALQTPTLAVAPGKLPSCRGRVGGGVFSPFPRALVADLVCVSLSSGFLEGQSLVCFAFGALAVTSGYGCAPVCPSETFSSGNWRNPGAGDPGLPLSWGSSPTPKSGMYGVWDAAGWRCL